LELFRISAATRKARLDALSLKKEERRPRAFTRGNRAGFNKLGPEIQHKQDRNIKNVPYKLLINYLYHIPKFQPSHTKQNRNAFAVHSAGFLQFLPEACLQTQAHLRQ